MKIYTITEYANKIGKSREAVFYQIKTKKIKARKNKKNQWEIVEDEPQTEKKENLANDNLLDLKTEVEVLKEKIKGLEKELENKNEIIKAKNETIEAEKRSNIALLHNLQTQAEQQKKLEHQSKKGFLQKLKFWEN